MIPELGHFALIIAVVLSLLLVVIPWTGSMLRHPDLMAFARPLATGQFVFLALAFGCLAYAFLVDDFSVQYVANNSNSLLPWYYKFSAVWGSHEGSLLLWMLILGGWTLAVAAFSRNLPQEMVARVLSVMGMVAFGFGLFVLATSNPFLRFVEQVPTDGADLNPLLQDIGLIMHPPMLYMGYVGFSVVFAFAIAALSTGRLDAAWARWSRPWTTVAWAFLTTGIALGSWWAYYELGWGGWWFWDPVENASFMPWLAGTALIHSLAVTEKRGVFKSWTVLLAIIAFSLSLLGTFLVRSGVLTSVHAFATDPERGLFVLVLLGVTLIGSLVLYALRAPVVRSRAHFGTLSREMFLLVNNVLLVVALLVVLVGTLYPLVMDYLGLGKLSVGPPYFNSLFVPIACVTGLLLGVGIFSRWKRTVSDRLFWKLLLPAGCSVLVAAAVPFWMGEPHSWGAFIGLLVATWVAVATFRDLFDKASGKRRSFWSGMGKLSRSYWGMVLGHLGLAVSIAGVTVVSGYSVERSVRLAVGQSADVGGYEWRFESLRQVEGPNYQADRATISIWEGGDKVSTLYPEKRRYHVQRNVMTEAGIDAGFLRDLYVALGEPLEQQGEWAVRVQYKPLVRWVWLGGVLMALGGFMAVADRRYRVRQPAARTASRPAPELKESAV
ncbi:heme lyase CcmF/NrfE family subunit [Marinobacteraceae bacterium S3BR75-40.1]